MQVARHIASPLKPYKEFGKERLKDKILWASELGEACNRKLWYKFHLGSDAEPIDGAAKFKFTYGHVIEEMALTYAVAAGYDVKDKQYLLSEVLANGWIVRGRIDGAVSRGDGPRFVVDVKSCSSAAFTKYSFSGPELSLGVDSFGYNQQLLFYDNNIAQLPSYVESDMGWKSGEFLFIDKQLGKMRSMGYPRTMASAAGYRNTKGGEGFAMAMASTTPPHRGFADSVDGASGNRKLGMHCSYCQFKTTCWPGLRAFKYSTGPRFLTKVAKAPAVPEIPLMDAPADPEPVAEGAPAIAAF